MEANYILVRFCEEKKYAVVSESKLVSLELDINTQKYLGMTTQVNWRKGKNYDAEIISVGAEQDLTRLQDHLNHSYLLVNWIEEPSFTIISKSKLVDVADLLADSDSLIGSTTWFNWTPKTTLEGHILSIGDVQTLNVQLKKAQTDMNTAGESAAKKGKRKIIHILEGISSVLGDREPQKLADSARDSQQIKKGKSIQAEDDDVILEDDQSSSQADFVAGGECQLVSSQPGGFSEVGCQVSSQARGSQVVSSQPGGYFSLGLGSQVSSQAGGPQVVSSQPGGFFPLGLGPQVSSQAGGSQVVSSQPGGYFSLGLESQVSSQAGGSQVVSSQPGGFYSLGLGSQISSQPGFAATTENHQEVFRNSQVHQVPSTEFNDPFYWKSLYENEKMRAEIYKNKAQNLQQKLNGYIIEHGEVDLGDGVKVLKSDLNAVYTISNKSTHFARNMMRLLFKEEEMVNRSMFGRKCNANRDMEAKAEIDPKRRDAIVATTLAKYSRTEEAKDAVRRVVIDSMNDFLRELTKKYVKRAQKKSQTL